MVKYLLVNDSIKYLCDFYDNSYDNELKLRVHGSDINKIRQDFQEISAITVMDENELQIFTTSQYTVVSDITILLNFYINQAGQYDDGIQLILKKPDLQQQLKQLEQIVNPVINESAMSLEDLKAHKISQSKNSLQQYLEEHPLISSCRSDQEGIYSVTKEKQDLMMSNYMSYQLEKTINPEAALTWNEKGKECETWTEEEFLQLILEVKKYVSPLVSLQQKYEAKIEGANSIDEVKQIVPDYENGVLRES